MIVLANGDELLQVIERFCTLEWRKFQPRIVFVKLKRGESIREDHSTSAPFTSFRVTSGEDLLIKRLRSALQAYEGGIKWSIVGHDRHSLPGTNWIIQPVFVDEMQSVAEGNGAPDVRSYIAQRFPDFALAAYADLCFLAEHVDEILAKQ
ncbi:hypothetical protein [Cupriavidus plantarum]|uniref:hypothetical protein n=1 Tax=Cupriavidus plantarum TaxID=942865 RepID=UPI0011C02BEA|nr:hypothetical protein [Cupriavidus plantarum]